MENSVVDLDTVVTWFEESEDVTRESRQESERCRDYYDHKQWTQEERQTLTKRKQPAITRNRIKPKVDFLRGLEAQTRTDPKAFPRNPNDDESAEAATDAIRYVCDDNLFAQVRSGVFENLVVEGTGGAEVFVKKTAEGPKIVIKRFFWDRIFYDIHSREKDFSDALSFGGVIWMDRKQAKAQWGEINIPQQEANVSDTYDDAPRTKWTDAKRDRVRIVQMWFKENGDWYWCEFTKGAWLTAPEKSPYVDDEGNTEPALILQSSHVDREGNRYGLVKAWLDVQDEINKRASKHLHLVSVRQTYSTKGAVPDAAALKKELAKPDGHLEFVAGEFGKDFGVLPTMDMAQAQFNLMQEAKAEIDSVGVHAALSGADQRDLSGRAINRLQQGASTEVKPIFDALAQFNHRVYKAVWNRVRQFWTAEKWVRVTDDENNLKWVGLNVPETYADQISAEFGGVPPELQGDPRLKMQTGNVKNNVAQMTVDIVLEDVPDTMTVQQEQFEALTAIFQAVPDQMKPAAFEMLVQASTIRNKSEFLERLKSGGADPQQQAAMQRQQAEAQQMQQLHMQLEMREKAAKTAKTEAEAGKIAAETQKIGVETAQTALAPMMGQIV